MEAKVKAQISLDYFHYNVQYPNGQLMTFWACCGVKGM